MGGDSWVLFFYKQAYDNYSKNIGDNVFKCILLKSFVPFYFHVLIHPYVCTYFVQESTLNSNFEWFALLID